MKKLIPIFMCITSAMAWGCESQGDPSDTDLAALSISMTSVDVTVDEGRRSVASLGTIKNPTPTCFDEVVVEAKYFDANKRHVDTVVQRLYGVVIPANGEVSFRIYDAAAKTKADYVDQQVRILDADARNPIRASKSQTHWLKEFLFSWGPMLLLIGVWLFAMRKLRGKDSPQERSLALMQQQLSVQELQNKELSRLAAAVERAVASRNGG